MKRKSNRFHCGISWRYVFFVLGSTILIGNTIVMGCVLPEINIKLQNASDNLADVEKQITEKAFKLRDFQNWEAKSSNTRNTLILMEGLDLQKTAQYKRVAEYLVVEQVFALWNLAAVSNVNVDAQLNTKWEQMSPDRLQDEKKQMVRENPAPFRESFARRDKFQAEKSEEIKILSNVSWITAVFQGIAMLLLAVSELLFKRHETKIERVK